MLIKYRAYPRMGFLKDFRIAPYSVHMDDRPSRSCSESVWLVPGTLEDEE